MRRDGKAGTCSACAHSFEMKAERSTELLCRRFPPQVIVFPVRSLVAGAGIGMAPAAGFPQVDRAAYCGEFAPAVDGENKVS